MYIFRALLIVALLFSLSGCDSGSNKQTANKAFVPTLNKHPRYYFNVVQNINSKVDDDIAVTWTVSYYTKNPSCYLTVNEFEGVTSPREINLTYKKSGNATFRIPLDKYLSGRCGWAIGGLSYTVSHVKLSNTLGTGFNFIANYPLKLKTLNQRWLCSKINCKLTDDDFLKLPQYGDLYPRENYVYHLTID